MIPYDCDTCGTTVTDHDLSDERVNHPARGNGINLVCEDCFAQVEDNGDDDDDSDWPADRPFDPYRYYGVSRHDF